MFVFIVKILLLSKDKLTELNILDMAKTTATDIQQRKMNLSRLPFVLKLQTEISNYLFGSSKVKNNPTVRQLISDLNVSGIPITQDTKGYTE
jgi:hypothetical protein